MIDSSKSPERLDKDNLLNVAVVLSNIKEAASDNMDSETVVDVPVEFKSSYIGATKVPLEMLINAEKSKVEVMEYLTSQGVLQKSTFTREARDYDFLVSLQPDNFLAYYNRVVGLTFPYIEELIRLSNQSPRSTRPQTLDDSSSPAPLPEIVLRLGKDFAIHEHNILSYKGNEIHLEAQEARILAFIMKRSVGGGYTSAEHISAEIVKGDSDSLKPEAYVRKIISNGNKAFRIATQSDTKYFVNKHSIGYRFNY